jgi:hypothetical protein
VPPVVVEVVEEAFKHEVSAKVRNRPCQPPHTPGLTRHVYVLPGWIVNGADWAKTPVLSRRFKPICVSRRSARCR